VSKEIYTFILLKDRTVVFSRSSGFLLQ